MWIKQGPEAFIEGPKGKLAVPAEDGVLRKFAMLYEGVCEGLGATQAARQHGYTKQRFYQLQAALAQGGVRALQGSKRGPKGPYRCTEEVVRQVIRYRFLDPDASAAVIARKLNQTGHGISVRSVQRVIEYFGLQKKPLSV
jgi:hypothetical protein